MIQHSTETAQRPALYTVDPDTVTQILDGDEIERIAAITERTAAQVVRAAVDAIADAVEAELEERGWEGEVERRTDTGSLRRDTERADEAPEVWEAVLVHQVRDLRREVAGIEPESVEEWVDSLSEDSDRERGASDYESVREILIEAIRDALAGSWIEAAGALSRAKIFEAEWGDWPATRAVSDALRPYLVAARLAGTERVTVLEHGPRSLLVAVEADADEDDCLGEAEIHVAEQLASEPDPIDTLRRTLELVSQEGWEDGEDGPRERVLVRVTLPR